MLTLIIAILIVVRGIYCYICQKKFLSSYCFELIMFLLIFFEAIILLSLLYYSEVGNERFAKAIEEKKETEREIDQIYELMDTCNDNMPKDTAELYLSLIELEEDRIKSAEETIKIEDNEAEKKIMKFLLYFGK